MLPAVTYVVGVPLGLLTLGLSMSRWSRPRARWRRVRRWTVIVVASIAVTMGWPYLVVAAIVGGGVVLGLGFSTRLPAPPPAAAPAPLAPHRPRRRHDQVSPRAVADYWDEVARQEQEQRLREQRDWDDWRWGHRPAPPPGY